MNLNEYEVIDLQLELLGHSSQECTGIGMVSTMDTGSMSGLDCTQWFTIAMDLL